MQLICERAFGVADGWREGTLVYAILGSEDEPMFIEVNFRMKFSEVNIAHAPLLSVHGSFSRRM